MNSPIKPTTILIHENLEAQTNEILDSTGVNCNNFVVMATHQLVNQKRIPYEVIPTMESPNEKRRALVAA